jgi:hypothetical protein
MAEQKQPHLPSAMSHLPSAICHLPFAICHLPFGQDALFSTLPDVLARHMT